MLKNTIDWFRWLFKTAGGVCLSLFKIMIPALIAVKILEIAGIFEPVAGAVAPVMKLAGLPGETGVAWVTGMLSNMYGGLTVTAGMIRPLHLTMAQVTTLCGMLLVSHSLPVEIAVASGAGVKPWFLVPFRLVTGMVFGIFLGQFFRVTGMLQNTPVVLWKAAEQGAGITEWSIGTLRSMGTIFLVILAVLGLMDVLEKLGIITLLKRFLKPVFAPMGIGDEASTITVIGLVLGISYGGGMIIREADRGTIPPRQILASISFMSICHAVVEDTILVGSLGAWAVAALPGRVAFSWVTMFILLLLSRQLPDKAIKTVCNPPTAPASATVSI
jgi:hypothetical protein